SRLLPPARSPLFPYTTLFRSLALGVEQSPEVADDPVRHRFCPRGAVPRGARRGGLLKIFGERALGRQLIGVVIREFVGRDESGRSEEHTSELQSLTNLVCRLL